MKLFDADAPNPKVVRMFIAEKGLNIERETVDMLTGQNRTPEFMKKNPSGQLPVLETNDGAYISEVNAICEYIDEQEPGGNLIGETAIERAETRMWLRKVDLAIAEPLSNSFRFGELVSVFENRIPTYPSVHKELRSMSNDGISWLNAELEGKIYLAGNRFTLADIFLYAILEFFMLIGFEINKNNKNITTWLSRIAERESSKA